MQEEHNNHFQNLNIFENKEINRLCDTLSYLAKKITGEELKICGSMAKVFDGRLPKNYRPKDVDFTLPNYAFRLLKNQIPTEIEDVIMIEKQPDRIILYAGVCLEIWRDVDNIGKEKKYYKTKIPYLI